MRSQCVLFKTLSSSPEERDYSDDGTDGGVSRRRTSLTCAHPRAPEASSTRSQSPLGSRMGTTSPSRRAPMASADGEAASRSGGPSTDDGPGRAGQRPRHGCRRCEEAHGEGHPAHGHRPTRRRPEPMGCMSEKREAQEQDRDEVEAVAPGQPGRPRKGLRGDLGRVEVHRITQRIDIPTHRAVARLQLTSTQQCPKSLPLGATGRSGLRPVPVERGAFVAGGRQGPVDGHGLGVVAGQGQVVGLVEALIGRSRRQGRQPCDESAQEQQAGPPGQAHLFTASPARPARAPSVSE